MIARLSADTLRKIAQQLDAYRELYKGGAEFPKDNTVIYVDESPVAYLQWNETREEFSAEITSFTPGNATPLRYHDSYKIS